MYDTYQKNFFIASAFVQKFTLCGGRKAGKAMAFSQAQDS
jgi:hypothetical protein